ncbi:nucleoside hydrolase [Tatumella morbirosei]|uniref:nucleoside hydrolase n=1 Tax=Tatumella morbirosei TaxID=642227 RepID=UPI000629EBC7|nr:nucleoside hydrolase [Tatumella morbirosei]
MLTRKIIIDTDPGQDDAIAILMAFSSPEQIELLGITTLAGNVPVELTTKNALKICELAGKQNTKVYSGASGPLKGKVVTAEHIHGKTGMDGPLLPEPTMEKQEMSAVDFIIDQIRKNDKNSITLCTLGPLTNIAIAIEKDPDIKEKIKEIIMMGGGFFEGGNITPSSEFNIYADPEAAEIVINSGIPIVMMPLDVTHQLLTLKRRIANIRHTMNPVGLAVAEMLEFAERSDKEKYGAEGGPLHDPTVIAYLLSPQLFSGRYCNVCIEVKSPLTRGMTVVDWWGVTDRQPNVMFMRHVDDEGFYTLLTERIQRYSLMQENVSNSDNTPE